MDITKNKPIPCNDELFLEQVSASFPEYNSRPDSITVLNVQASDESILDTIIANHNAALVTESQQIESASTTARVQAREYLLRQLLSPSPTVTIYSVVKGYVDNNTRLLAMMNTLQSLSGLAFGWNVAALNNPANNNDRGRYLILALILVALLH